MGTSQFFRWVSSLTTSWRLPAVELFDTVESLNLNVHQSTTYKMKKEIVLHISSTFVADGIHSSPISFTSFACSKWMGCASSQKESETREPGFQLHPLEQAHTLQDRLLFDLCKSTCLVLQTWFKEEQYYTRPICSTWPSWPFWLLFGGSSGSKGSFDPWPSGTNRSSGGIAMKPAWSMNP